MSETPTPAEGTPSQAPDTGASADVSTPDNVATPPTQETAPSADAATPPVDGTNTAPPPAEGEAPPPETSDDQGEDPNRRVVPETADGYNLPEGVSPLVGEFALKNNMTQQQLDSTLTEFGNYSNAVSTAQRTSIEESGQAHLKTWGEKADSNLSLAKRALQQNDPEGAFTKILHETGYGSHPAVLDFLHKLGSSMDEGGFLKGRVHRPPGQKTVAEKMFPSMS